MDSSDGGFGERLSRMSADVEARRAAVREEREACAAMVEALALRYMLNLPDVHRAIDAVAQAIRART